MYFDPNQHARLVDSHGRLFGLVDILRIENAMILGTFRASEAYESVSPLFRSLEEAANEQLFHEAERWSDEIESLGLSLQSEDGEPRLALQDVQIMNDHEFSCRVPRLRLVQIAAEAAEAT